MILKMIDEEVTLGKMMSCPGLMYHGKVFCFEYKDKMVFKLGKGYDIEKHGITDYDYLNPFKNKGPMMAWFEISLENKDCFEKLAQIALRKIKND